MKVAFLDRDGVINKEVNYLYKIKDFQYTEKCVEALLCLQNHGFKLIVITNQAGIARGYYNFEQYQELTDWYVKDLAKYGVEILDVYHCPHHLQGVVEGLSIDCECRKPKAGMFIEAINKYNINTQESIMVGDKLSDIQAALSIGVSSAFLVEGEVKDTSYKIYKNLFHLSKSL